MKKVLNIVLGVLIIVTAALVIWAAATGGNETAISANLIWGYALLALAALAVVGCALTGMVKNPAGIKATLVAIVIVAIVVGGSVAFAMSHKGMTIPNSAGGVFDDPFELIITEASIVVTYVAAAAAIVMSLVSEVVKLFR